MRAFLFDMDGVIVHSTPLHNRAWELYLDQHGIDPLRVQTRMFGLRNDEIVRDFFGEGLSEAEIVEHGANKEKLYRELMYPRLEEFMVPGVREFLARHSFPAAVGSNAEPENIEFVLNESGLRPRFSAVVDGYQVEKPKPDPQVYLRAAEILGVAPEQCIVFEDSIAGLRAARASGARVVGLRTTLRELPSHDLAIDNFDAPELESWLEALPR
ncbi:MAG TPA: HAD family phosphatase [bacterium]|nr:HAD family phosphatase [bacterium]